MIGQTEEDDSTDERKYGRRNAGKCAKPIDFVHELVFVGLERDRWLERAGRAIMH